VGPITNFNIVNTGTTSQTYTYYVYASAINNPNCHDEQPFTFTVHPLLNIDFPDGVICVDPITNAVLQSYTMNTGLNPAVYTVEWYLNTVLVNTGPSYTATQAGIYTLHFIKLTPDIGAACNFNDTTVSVIQSSPAVANFSVSSEFDTNNTL